MHWDQQLYINTGWDPGQAHPHLQSYHSHDHHELMMKHFHREQPQHLWCFHIWSPQWNNIWYWDSSWRRDLHRDNTGCRNRHWLLSQCRFHWHPQWGSLPQLLWPRWANCPPPRIMNSSQAPTDQLPQALWCWIFCSRSHIDHNIHFVRGTNWCGRWSRFGLYVASRM